MSSPVVSVIVPSMGRLDLLLRLVTSLNDTLPGHLRGSRTEICFGYDPSTVHMPIDFDWPDFYITRRVAPEPGMSAAVNAAFAQAHGEWIVFVPDDVVFMPQWGSVFESLPSPIREDRILCFSLIEPSAGSFPPVVDAGHTPELFDAKRAADESRRRFTAFGVAAEPGRFFVGACVMHRSKWVPWPEWCDPYSCNDIAWMWETRLKHPDVAFGNMPGVSLYHFVRASVKEFGIQTPAETGQQFQAHYGLSIAEAYQHIYDRSVSLWTS